MAHQASQLYGTNLCHLLTDMGGAKDYKVDLEDEVVRGALVIHEGEVTWPPPKPSAPAEQPKPTQQQQPAKAQPNKVEASKESKGSVSLQSDKAVKVSKESKDSGGLLWLILMAIALVGVGITAPASFLSHFTVFVLACFVGWQVIWNVKPALHTPLMSVTNAISGIIIIGGMLQISGPLSSPTTILGASAILLGMINISGGFLVTQRMLKMFQK